MIYPTPEEIKASYDAITADGPQAEATIQLCTIILQNPLLREKAERLAGLSSAFKAITDLAGLPPAHPGLASAVAIMASGLNHGLRIGEARAAAARGEKQ